MSNNFEMSKRKRIPWYKRQYLVNREMQGKYAWSGVLIGLASSGLSAGMLLWSFWVFNIWQGQRLPKPVVLVICCVLFFNAASIYVATVLSTQRIAGPLFNLLKQFQRISQGDMRARAVFRKGDEIHYVGKRFNEMMDKICLREDTLFDQLERARGLLSVGDIKAAEQTLDQAAKIREKKSEPPA
jgi:methyl-accepting chemotaxis protein